MTRNYRTGIFGNNVLLTSLIGVVASVERKKYDPTVGFSKDDMNRIKSGDMNQEIRGKGVAIVDGGIKAAETITALRGYDLGAKSGKRSATVMIVDELAKGKKEGGLISDHEHIMAVAEYSRAIRPGMAFESDKAMNNFFQKEPLEIVVARLQAENPSARLTHAQVFECYDENDFNALAEGLRSTSIALAGFYEKNPQVAV